MSPLDRRGFLAGSLGALAAGCSIGDGLLGSRALSAVARGDEATASDGPASLILTWQGDPTTSIAVQWIGVEGEFPTQIRYGRVDGDWIGSANAATSEYPGTDLKVHRCLLTGLEPGTEYRFALGPKGTPRRFRTMPAKATDSFDFVTGGDCGTGSHAVEINRLAARQEPWFALIAGDLAYDNGASPDTFRKFVENYSGTMVDPEGRMIPLVTCLGNHEVAGGYRATRAKGASYFSLFDGFYAETTYGVVDVGDYLSLVLLDTNHVSPIAGEQTDWLRRTLADRQERPHLIVANHVPAYPSYREPWSPSGDPGTGADNRRHWCPLFERYNVDVVLEHHDHTFKRTHPLKDGKIDENGVLYLGDGSWGKLRPPQSPEDRPYLARVAGSYHVTMHRLEGDRRFHIALEESGRIADVCTTTSKRPAKGG